MDNHSSKCTQQSGSELDAAKTSGSSPPSVSLSRPGRAQRNAALTLDELVRAAAAVFKRVDTAWEDHEKLRRRAHDDKSPPTQQALAAARKELDAAELQLSALTALGTIISALRDLGCVDQLRDLDVRENYVRARINDDAADKLARRLGTLSKEIAKGIQVFLGALGTLWIGKVGASRNVPEDARAICVGMEPRDLDASLS